MSRKLNYMKKKKLHISIQQEEELYQISTVLEYLNYDFTVSLSLIPSKKKLTFKRLEILKFSGSIRSIE